MVSSSLRISVSNYFALPLCLAVERALTYLETGRVPGIWEENTCDVIVHEDSEEDCKKLHSSEDESSSIDEDGEKKAFKEKLFAFMKDKGYYGCHPFIRFLCKESSIN